MPNKEQAVNPTALKQLIVQELRKTVQYPGIFEYNPLPKQEQFHRSKAKGKLMMGGNRVGKTVSGGAETVMRMTGTHKFRNDLPKPPIRARGVAVDFDRGVKLIMIPEIKRWLPSEFYIGGTWERSYSVTDKILTLNNGSTMEFMSYEQDVGKFQGTSRHFVWFDEEPSQEIYNECMARLIDTDGDWFITMTPLIEMSWTYDTLYVPAKEGTIDNVDIFEATTDENTHISKQAFDRLTQTLSNTERETRKTGVYISHTGLVYGESFSRHKNVCVDLVEKTERFEALRKHWTHFLMMDHGYNNPTAFLFGAVNDDGVVIIYDEIYVNKTLVRDIAELVKDRILALGIQVEYTIGDPSIANTDPLSGSSVQSEYGMNGVNIGLGNNDVQSGITTVQHMLKFGKLFISERCKHTLREIHKYRWDRHITKIRDRRNLKEEPLKKDDHTMDALRYGIMSLPKRYIPIDNDTEYTLSSSRASTELIYAGNSSSKLDTYDSILGSES